MVCVDNDREIVAKNVLEFFGAALPGATLGARQRAEDDRARRWSPRLTRRRAKARAGDFSGLRDLAIPDLAWVQPGANRMSGAHVGQDVRVVREPHHAGARAAVHRVRHAGVQPRRRARARRRSSRSATAPRSNRRARCCSRIHGGKLLEARWFADDVEREDAFFGEPEPEAPGAVVARRGVRRRGRRVEDAAQGARQRHAARAVLALQAGDRGRRRRASAPARSTWSIARNSMHGPRARERRARTR